MRILLLSFHYKMITLARWWYREVEICDYFDVIKILLHSTVIRLHVLYSMGHNIKFEIVNKY